MLSRKTRSNKDNQLLFPLNQELLKLERTGRRAKNKPASMFNPVILRHDNAGVIIDQEGYICNNMGQRLDEDGNPIVPVAVVGTRNTQNRGSYSGYGQRNDYTSNQNSFGYESKPQYQTPLQANSSFTRNYEASSYQKPQASNEQSEIKAIIEQVLEGQQKVSQSNTSFTRNYASASYQTPLASNEQSDMKAMLEQILEEQQKMTVNFNEKIDALYTDLNEKYESLNSHVKKLDIQVAQTAGSVKCNAIIQRNGKELKPELRSGLSAAEIAEIEKNTAAGVSVSIDTTSVSLDTNCRPTDEDQAARVDRHHLCVARHKDPSDAEFVVVVQSAEESIYETTPPCPRADEMYEALIEMIGIQVPWIHEFRDLPCVKEVVDRAYKDEISLDEAANLVYVECAKIRHSRITKKPEEPENIPAPSLRQLPKIDDPGKFIVPCSISGVKFEDALCDSGSTVNLMPKDIADSLGITDTKPSRMTITFANAQEATPQCIENLNVRIGNCLVPTDFHILEMSGRSHMPLILGRSFLATAGAIVDLPNARVCLSNIDKLIFYAAIPEPNSKFSSYISNEEINKQPSSESPAASASQIEVSEVLPRDTQSETKSPPATKKDKPKRQIQPSCSKVTLTPLKRVGDTIEYKLKCKGKSRPFSKVRAIITPAFKEKGQEFLDGMLNKVLELNLHDQRTNRQRLNPPPPHPDPPEVSHHP